MDSEDTKFSPSHLLKRVYSHMETFFGLCGSLSFGGGLEGLDRAARVSARPCESTSNRGSSCFVGAIWGCLLKRNMLGYRELLTIFPLSHKLVQLKDGFIIYASPWQPSLIPQVVPRPSDHTKKIRGYFFKV